MYLLDTDHMSLLERGGADALKIAMRLGQVRDDQISTCIVVYEEQMRGWLAKAARVSQDEGLIFVYQSLMTNLEIYSGMNVLPFDDRALVEYKRLLSAKIRIGTPDLKIAAIALANSAVVLTRNQKHFGRISSLLTEDWSL